MELVSIVVPVYNIEQYIPRCIESIQGQTYQELEIILVDDGATDQSGDICDEYAKQDARIHVLHQKNGGLSFARNQGAAQATGKYLFFVDGDDFVSAHMVEKAVQCAEELDAELVFFDYESIEEETGRRDLYHFGLPRHQTFDVKSCPRVLIKSPSAWCHLYRKEFWDRTGIRYPLRQHYEDLATTPRFLLEAERIGYAAEEPLYYYTLREGSIMRSNDFERSFEDRSRALDDLLAYFKKQNQEEQYKAELEYLFFEHGYFVPSKEIVLADERSVWLSVFQKYSLHRFPKLLKNRYISELSFKDKVMLFLLKREMYKMMNQLSEMRKRRDSVKESGKRVGAKSAAVK